MSGETTFSYLDSYCERAGDPGLWAEPLNAVTNLAFLVAAWLAYRDFQRSERHICIRTADLLLLVVTLAAIGIGSGLWHTHATQATMLADVLPITLFINLYLIAFLRRVVQLRWLGVLGWWGLFLAATVLSEMFLPRDLLNGSVMYLPALLTLLLLGGWSRRHHVPETPLILGAIGLFAVSVIFRTIDLAVCDGLPFGTHFLWHVLNAAVLYTLLKALITRAHLNGH